MLGSELTESLLTHCETLSWIGKVGETPYPSPTEEYSGLLNWENERESTSRILK